MPLLGSFTKILNDSHNTVWNNYERLKILAIRYGLDPVKLSKWKGPGEPALAYGAMSWWSCQEFAHAIQLVEAGISAGRPMITYGFIHQKPKVSYSNLAGVAVQIELGDLLVIRHHFKFKSSVPEGRAFIIQAKANKSPSTGALSPGDRCQLELYQDWSKGFTFPHGEFKLPRNGKEWNFSKGTQAPVSHTGIYGVVLSIKKSTAILTKFPDACVWAVGFPSSTISRGKSLSVPAKTMSLSAALSGLVQGGFGRTWVTNPMDPDDHWSEFINSVLSSADMKSSNAKLGRIGQEVPRLQEVTSFASSIPGLTYLLDNNHSRSSSLQEHKYSAIEDWQSSLIASDQSPPGAFGNEAPASPHPGGMPFIYIATFGENSLDEPLRNSPNSPL